MAIKDNYYITIIYSNIFRMLFKIMQLVIKVDEESIMFVSFAGKNYDSNPRYFSDYIYSKKSNFKIFWAFEKPENFPQCNFKKLKFGSIAYFITLLKCKYWIFDVSISRGIHMPTKKHIVVYTGHGLAYKYIGKDIKYYSKADWYRDKIIFKMSDYVLSQSRIYNKILSQAYEIAESKFLDTGYPRNDILFEKVNSDAIRKKYNLPLDKTIILYLPTMREWMVNEEFPIQQDDILKLKDDFIIIFKAHPSSKIKVNGIKSVYDFTNVENLTDLFFISDILLTDYSSALFDYMILNKPIILYQYDYEDYKNKRGLYFTTKELPLFRAENSSTLINYINGKKYTKQNLEKTKSKFIEYEKGNACEQLALKLFR